MQNLVNTGSPSFSLNQKDLLFILFRFLVALAACVAVFLPEEFIPWLKTVAPTWVHVTLIPVIVFLVELLNRWVRDNRSTPVPPPVDPTIIVTKG
jgi:hypothetical protein